MQTELDTYNVALNGLVSTMNTLVLIDPLTGTLNRRGLWERITKDVHEHLTAASFIVIDVDYFKNVNDQYGHPAGDTTLRRLATLAKGLSRPKDAIGRIGGDEFIWWVPDLLDQSILGRRLQDLSTALSNQEPLTFSAGISRYPIDGQTVEQLYATADEAMYRAKHAGRRRWCTAGVNEIYSF
jgi:diguanylate cyclase (GGDEF)-like protein